ncbi:iron transporter [Pseudomonas sp. 5P_3.1_Bac2]|uniref:iron transporter n=1 Tax=Pseudomonas sp. 5P_3.1_Bac2 TaxID=2971617 RepID=UPI0021C8BF68|nr:iron transporter [Pseudomonas sp. 5P_3.1_Bac2]MCU1718109.1 iron transporter [Pseudomonas sp. 5P_3.1_Bac2]
MTDSLRKQPTACAAGQPSGWAIAHRLLLALLGGYAFTWGFVSLGVVLLSWLQVDYHDAEHGMLLLSFLLYLALFLWAFAAASTARVWLVLGGGAVVMIPAALQLQKLLLS